MFPDLQIMGWYSNGNSIKDSDIELQKQIEIINESAFFLLIDTDPHPDSKELPIYIYESHLKVVNEEAKLLFAKIEYKIESGDAERLAVDHVARFSTSTTSLLHSHLQSMCNSIKMLKSRLDFIISFLKQCQANSKEPIDPSILRNVAILCNMLPTLNTETFNKEFLIEYNDSLLMTHLSTVLKASNVANDLIDKFNMAYDKKPMGRLL